MRIHLIAIGGSAMHNLALALHQKGYTVTGSDDEIFEPSRTRLEKSGLLPQKLGWFPEKITCDIDAVIVGMHAREDNPEVIKAKQLWLKIYSYPEYLYNQTSEKKRVVIAGSHGKTTITGMIMHVLNHYKRDFDYMVGAKLEGFDTMVKLTDSAPLAIFEGDEYLSSPLDKRPKFHLYKPHIALLSGIAWDHINVFPTFENYKQQFRDFLDLMEPNGTLYYYQGDPELVDIIESSTSQVNMIPYVEHENMVRDHITYLLTQSGSYKLNVFGKHNLQNISGAKLICNQLEITDVEFYKAISSYKGASKRLQVLHNDSSKSIFLDFAHAPSKVKATVAALKEQYPDRKLIACLELHTFSSLTKEFILEYNGTLSLSDSAIVYYNPKTIAHKKLPELSKEYIQKAFNYTNLNVFTDSKELQRFLKKQDYKNSNLLFMSSGNFDNIDLHQLAEDLSL